MSNRDRSLFLLLGLGLLILMAITIGAWWAGMAGRVAILNVIVVLLLLLITPVLGVAGLALILWAWLGEDE